MSFNDLERGATPNKKPVAQGLTGSVGRGASASKSGSGSSAGTPYTPLPLYHAPPSSSSSGSPSPAASADEHEFNRLSERMGIQIFKLNSNVSAIDKLVQLSSAPAKHSAGKEARDWTKQVADLTETTRALSKSLTTDLKSLTALKLTRPAQRVALNKLRSDLESALKGFARAQQAGANRTRDALDGARNSTRKEEERRRRENEAALEAAPLVDTSAPGDAAAPAPEAQQEQAQAQVQVQAGPSQADLEFQEALIAEREAEIREIEGGIHELNEIFRDLGHIVQEQGGMVDNIEFNVQTIATSTGAADRELVSAHEYQRKAGRRAACLLMVVGFVVAIVLIAALS